MTTPCPICRSPVEVDDASVGPDGVSVQCPLCDEVFTVRHPAASPSPPAGATQSVVGSAAALTGAARSFLDEESIDGPPARVLVAHDSHSFGDLVKDLLGEQGFHVDVVYDGDEAMRAVETDPPAVAILEAGLPKRLGFKLCAEMRALPAAAPVKILLVASIYDRKRIAAAVEIDRGPHDFVEPRNIETELVPKVRRLLRGRPPEGTYSKRAAEVGAAPASSAAADEPAPTRSSASPSASLDDDPELRALLGESASYPAVPLRGERPAAPPRKKTPPPPSMSPSLVFDEDDLEIWAKVIAEGTETGEGTDDELMRDLIDLANEPSVSRDAPSVAPGSIPPRGTSSDKEDSISRHDLVLDELLRDSPTLAKQPSPPSDDDVLESILRGASETREAIEPGPPAREPSGPRKAPAPGSAAADDDILKMDEFLASEPGRSSTAPVRNEDSFVISKTHPTEDTSSFEPVPRPVDPATASEPVTPPGPRPASAGSAATPADHQKAQRLAKLIVQDIVLYCQDRLAEAVRTGQFFELVKGDVKDGRLYYDEKIPEAVRAERDYIQECLDEVVATKRRELGL